MSLTTDDLGQIRAIIESALAKQSADTIKPLQDEIQAFRNDIKGIYDITARFQESGINDEKFANLGLEEQILALNTKLLAAAKQAGISLPR